MKASNLKIFSTKGGHLCRPLVEDQSNSSEYLLPIKCPQVYPNKSWSHHENKHTIKNMIDIILFINHDVLNFSEVTTPIRIRFEKNLMLKQLGFLIGKSN